MNEPPRDLSANCFLPFITKRLVELANLKSGDRVLELTDRGVVATLFAAAKVEPGGQVNTLDRSLLSQDRSTELPFAAERYDCILYPSAPWLRPDLLPLFHTWRRILKPGGRVAMSGYGNRSWQPLASLLEICLGRYDLSIALPGKQRLATLEQYSDLLRNGGFSVIDVRSEHASYHLTSPAEWWDLIACLGLHNLLGQLPLAARNQFKQDYLAAATAVATPCGIELEVVAIFAVGQK